MKSTLLTYIDRFRQNRRERLVLGSVLLFLAVIVSLIVYWQLRYTGITMSNETFCGYEEHVHTEECYDEEGNLVCELEEHTHTVDCLINLNADVEDASIWKATLPELTGDLRTDVVNIAYSQLGYTESTANFSPGEDGVTRYGYTRYGAWYGNEYGTWDAMFVSFCLNYAGVDRTAFPLNSGAYSWAVELSEIGSYAEASAYTPLAGDIVFFDSDYDGRIDRVGIVASTDISGGVVTIIEGDYTVSEVDTVCEHIYALNDPTISGYGIIAASEEVEEETEEAETEETGDETEDTEESEEVEIDETEDTEETEEETEESPTLFYTASDSGVNVTVIAPEGALPDGATLAVTLLDEESDEYAEAAEAVGYEDSEDTGMAALDITFYDEFGIEVEPALPVTVTVDITEIIPEGTTADTIEVTHITDTEVSTVETLVETVTDTTDETAVVVFETESFSTFTLQWSYQDGWQTKTVTVIATTYLYYDDTTVIGNETKTLSVTLGSPYDLTSTNTDLAIEGYTLVQADVGTQTTSYDRWTGTWTTTTNIIAYNVSTITYTRPNNGQPYYSIDGERSYSIGNNDTVIINLYYSLSSASITINKYETGDTTYTQLSGATFTLTLSDSTETLENIGYSGISSVTYSNDNKTITFTTEGSAIKFTNLPDGTYTLTETSAPSGYTRADESFTFTVSGNSIESASTSTDGSYTYSSNAVSFYDDPITPAFKLQWSANTVNSLAASVNCYYDGATEPNNSLTPYTGTLWVGYDNEVDFDSNNVLLAVDGYTLNGATITVNGSDTYEDVESIRAVYDWNGTWTYEYLKDGTWYTIGTSSAVTSLTIDLQYEKDDEDVTGDLYIVDDIENSGCLKAVYEGTYPDNYFYKWFKLNTDTGEYEEIAGEITDTLSVYMDGARETYKVELWSYNPTEEVAESAHYQVPYYDQLQNGSFESPSISGNAQITNQLYYEMVWQTTGLGSGNTTREADGQDIEIVNASGAGSSYGETKAADGYQYAELNCEVAGTLYQDVLTIPDAPLYWNFAHEGRDGTDSMCVIIVDAEYAGKYITEQSNINAIYQAAQAAAIAQGTTLTAIAEDEYSAGITFEYTDSESGESITLTFWLITSDSDTWHYYYGEYTVPSGQYLTRFLFGAISTSSSDNTTGNLIDGISFSQEAASTSNSGNITITKTVEGVDTDEVIPKGTYTFNIYHSNGYGYAEPYATVSLPTVDATVSQTAYWTYTFTNIVSSGSYYVVEVVNDNITDYTYESTSYVMTSSNANSGSSGATLQTEEFVVSTNSITTIAYTNTYTSNETYSGVEMPQTGGRGTKLYTMVGLLLMCSGGYLLYRKQRRKCKWRWNI